MFPQLTEGAKRGLWIAIFLTIIKLGYDLQDPTLSVRYIVGDLLIVAGGAIIARVFEATGDGIRAGQVQAGATQLIQSSDVGAFSPPLPSTDADGDPLPPPPGVTLPPASIVAGDPRRISSPDPHNI